MFHNVVTLSQVKDWLDISGSTQDSFLKHLIDACTVFMESYMNTFIITRKTEETFSISRWRDPEIYLSKYPIYVNSDFKIYNDVDREFGSDTEVSSDDYYLDEKIGKVKFTGSLYYGDDVLKVIYWAGWSRFKIWLGVNDKIVLTESGGSKVTVTVDYGEYTAEDMATAIQTALNDDTNLTGTFTVSYSHTTQKFTISNTVNTTYHWTESTIGETIGFNTDTDGTSGESESDFAVSGAPTDLVLAAQRIIFKWYAESGKGDSVQELVQERIEQGGTREYLKQTFPIGVKEVLDYYKIV